MRTFVANIICREPVANGFLCSTDDEVVFSYAGDDLSTSNAEAVINDEAFVLKRCWKCFSQNWSVKELKSIAYQSRSEAVWR